MVGYLSQSAKTSTSNDRGKYGAMTKSGKKKKKEHKFGSLKMGD